MLFNINVKANENMEEFTELSIGYLEAQFLEVEGLKVITSDNTHMQLDFNDRIHVYMTINKTGFVAYFENWDNSKDFGTITGSVSNDNENNEQVIVDTILNALNHLNYYMVKNIIY